MSIKKKFATAVATASLLAGLFGSAFVPSASAGIILAADVVLPKYTTLIEGSEVQQAGTAKSFGFQSNDSDDTDVDVDAYIDVALYSAGASGNGTTAYDLDDVAKNNGVQLKAVSSNANVNVGWAYGNDDGLTAACSAANITVGTTSTFDEIEGTNGPGADTDETFRLCLAGETDATAATSTITVTVNNVVATTFSVTAVGPIDTLTASITDGFKYVAEDNSIVDDWFTIIAKDAAGVVINGLSTSVSNEDLTIFDWEGNPENAQEDQVMPLDGFDSGNDSVYDDPDEVQQYSVYDLDSATCASESGAGEEDGDAGASFSVKFADAATDADVVPTPLRSPAQVALMAHESRR
jgi:hypothetical protein